jgi:dihydropteroate synthase
MLRKHFEWRLRDRTLQLGERTLIMGVLNVTPDSFSDGGKFLDPDAAFAHAIALEDAGADILDVGAESTRPGSARISEAEELRRLVPVLKRLRGKVTIPISVDTYKSGVAAKALEHGAEIINDPSGLTFDPELARAVSNANAGLILCHMRGTPDTWLKLPPLNNPMQAIVQELDAAVHRAVRTGLDRRHLVIDPGLGFGKRKEQNAEILAFLDALSRLELPVLVGASRKHFLAKESAEHTEFATAAAVTASILHGAHLVRVHDVAAMKAAVEVADEILRAEAAAAAELQKDAGAAQARRPRLPRTAAPRQRRSGGRP